MALLSVIRRWALRDQLSIREIARRTGVSRNTIRKYLRAGTVEPAFKVPERPSKLDPFAEKLSAWLKTEAGKSRKERRTLKQLHADLVALGYAGSYNRVAAFARKWKADRQREQQTAGGGTFVPLVFQPGEAFQFDWSDDRATIAGENTKLRLRYIAARTFDMHKLQDQHLAVVQALRARDADAAEQAMRRHLRELLNDLPEIISARPELFAP